MKIDLSSGTLTSLPGRYAKALFDLSAEKKEIDEVGVALTNLSMLIQSSQTLKLVLKNPTLKRQEQEAALKEICKQMGAPQIVGSFASLLIKSSRMPYLSRIIRIYENLVSHAKGEQTVEIISAYPLTKAQSQVLRQKLAKVSSENLLLTFSTDPKVLGGIMVRIGSRVIDATLSTQLDQLATAMKGNA